MIIYTFAVFLELGAEPVPLAPLTSLPLLLAFSKPIKRVKLIVKRKKKKITFSSVTTEQKGTEI